MSSSVKIINTNYKPSAEELEVYKKTSGMRCQRRSNLRFGKIVGMSDSDIDG
jgi:DNA gyrase/topoisomerase IV subunit B